MRGVRKEYHHLEADVWKWVLTEGKRTGKLPTRMTIQRYAQEIYRAAGHTDFKASAGWYRRASKRMKGCIYEHFPEHSRTANNAPRGEILDPSPLPQLEDDINTCMSESLESSLNETDPDIETTDSSSEFFASDGDITITNSERPSQNVYKDYRYLEADVWTWTMAEYEKTGELPTKMTIRQHAQEVYRTAGHSLFKASAGWYQRWSKKYNLKDYLENLRTASTTSVKTPIPLQAKIPDSSPILQTSESFSVETDKLMSDIEMINSPSQFFDIIESADDVSNTDDIWMKNLLKELMDDFGRYCNETDSLDADNTELGGYKKKICKYYNKDFKDKVIGFISNKRTCIMEAALKFKISPETVSSWIKENKFQDQLTQIFIKESKKANIDSEIKNKEHEFCEWLKEQEKANKIVTENDVKGKLTNLFTATCCENSHWFAKYCFKYLCEKQRLKPMKINYSQQFQKLIVKYAARTSQTRTASVFNLARKQIFNWVKSTRSEEIDCKKKIGKELYEWYDSKTLKPDGRMVREKAEQLFNESPAPKNSYSWYYKWCDENNISIKRNCDEEIVQWILGAYDRNIYVSHKDVQKKALEIYNSHNEGTFKASTGWLLRFCRRYMNLLRRTPPLSEALPTSCEANITEVRGKIKTILSENMIGDDCYGVMDEIFLKLKPATNNSSQQIPLLRSCGTDNIQGTVILTCLSNGKILPPLLLLKDRCDMSDLDHPSVLLRSGEIVDENVIQFWLGNVWLKHVKQPNLLLMDCFEPHTNENVKMKFEKSQSHLVVIPAGCSSKLNPLTQIIIPQFQEVIDQHFRKWFEEDSLCWRMGSKSTSLSSRDMIDWVEKAFNSVNNESMEENVRNVFKKMELRM